MRIKLTNNKIEITFPYDKTLISIIKSFNGRMYSPATRSWFIPLTGASSAVIKLAGLGFTVKPEVWNAIRTDERTAKEAEAITALPDIDFTTTLPLYGYQKVGTAFLDGIGSGLLGDQPGAGKTLQVIALAEKNNADKVLVFCPAVLKHQWAGEVRRFVPSRKAVIVEGNKQERMKLWRSDGDYYVANYELLLRDFDDMNSREWDYIFADEATKISNPFAKQSRMIKKLRAKKRIAMTGTPISNTAQNIWNVLDFCNPGSMGNYFNFVSRYCLKNKFGGIFAYTNIDELQKWIKRYMIRRLKADILPELPPVIETDVPFALSEEELTLQMNIKKELLFEINKMDINKIEKPMNLQFTIAKFQRLRMLADSLELIGENKKSSKMEVLRELLEENVDNKIIIFSEFAEMCKILKREFAQHNPAMIIGETSSEMRQKELIRFKIDPECRLLISSSAGAYGLNLTEADTVINYDLPFSIAKLEQRIGRAHRIQQKKTVRVYNLLGEKTADMAIRKIIHGKQKFADELLGDRYITMQNIREILTYE